MRFVFFGLSLSSSWGNGHATTYRGLLGALQGHGHRVDFFERDVDWYARHRDLPNPPQAKLHLYTSWPETRAQAKGLCRQADAVVVGSYFPDAVAALDELLSSATPPVCFYDIDTPITLDTLRRGQCSYLRPDHIPAVALYLSFTGGPVLQELASTWGAKRVRTLYCACDELAYRRPAVAENNGHRGRYLLSFLGTFAPDRDAKLERLLLAPARRLPASSFAIAGSMYPAATGWPPNVAYQPHLPPERHPAFYAGSTFTLNLTRQAMVEAGYSPSVRLFEAAATATPVISDSWPGIEEFFQPGAEILVARDSEEVLRLLTHTSLDEAVAIGLAAQRRALQEHTSARRAAQLETYLCELS